MRILYCLFARMGDVCCGIPAYLALCAKYPEADLTWITLPKHGPLVPKCGNVKTVNDGQHGPLHAIDGWRSQYDIVINAQPMWHHKRWEKSGKHAIDLIADLADVKLGERRVVIETDKSVKQSMLAKLPKLPEKPFVTICSSRCYSCGDWPQPYRQKLVSVLKREGIRFVTVGGSDGHDIPGAYSAHGKLNFLETLALIRRSRVYVGPDTGPTWLACAASGTSKVCLIDKGRLRCGVVGFERFLDDKNIKDSFIQDGVDRHISLVRSAWGMK